MPINALIPLQAKAPNIGSSVMKFADDVVASRRQGRIDDLAARKTDLEARRVKTQEDKEAREAEEAKFKREGTDWAVSLARIAPALESGNNVGALVALQEREQRIRERGGDPRHTQELIRQIETDPDAALRDVRNELSLAERQGFITADEKAKGFTLAPGSTRFDQEGNEVASVAPTSKLLTPEEEAQQARIAAARRAPSQRDQDVADLIGRGVPENLARDISAGRIKVTQPDQFGNVFLVNTATGERRAATSAEAGAAAPVAAPAAVAGEAAPAAGAVPAQAASALPGTDTAIDEGVGPVAGFKEFASNVLGPFIDGALFPEATSARTQLRALKQSIKTAFANNPRFPVSEMEKIEGFLPDPDKFFNDPDAARADLQRLREFLQERKAINTRIMGSGRITSDKMGELSDLNATITGTLDLLGAGAPKDAGFKFLGFD